MRSIFLLTLSFCDYYSGGYGQTAISFHTVMKTGNVYRQTVQTETTIALNVDDLSQELKDAIQNNPMTANMFKKQQMLIETETRCGQPDTVTGLIPVRMKVTRDTGVMIAEVLPVGTSFYGHVSPGKLPVFDSTDIKGGTQMQSMLARMKNISAGIAFPDTTLSVGQTYTQVIPIDMPGGGMNMKMLMTQTYTLTGFSADTAGFDVKVKGTLDTGAAELPITGAAEGEGHLVYDRKNNFPTDNQLNVLMAMVITQGGNSMRMDIHSNQLTHVVISKE